MQPISVKTKIKLPDTSDAVYIKLVEQGPALVGYGITLYDKNNSSDVIVPFGANPLNTPYKLGAANTLTGKNTDCAGRVAAPTTMDVFLHCEFLINGKTVASSDTADVKLTQQDPSREFHIQCLFV